LKKLLKFGVETTTRVFFRFNNDYDINGIMLSYNFSDLCTSVFEINEKIRFVGIINQMGKLIAGDMKKGLTSMEREDGSMRLYLGYAINNVLRRDFDNVFGKVLYTFSEREQIKLLTIPLDDNLLLVSMDKSIDHTELIKKILAVVNKLATS
jgi:hypothetical protein